MTAWPLRIVKLGGSLLDWDGMPAALRVWLAKNDDAMNWIVVGGGRSADLVRQEFANGGLAEDQAHWLAIDAMQENARQVAEWMNWPFVGAAKMDGEGIPSVRCAEQMQQKHFGGTTDDNLELLPPSLSASPLPITPPHTSSPPRNIATHGPQIAVLELSAYLQHEEPQLPGLRLAHNWNVTSDSIAARFATTENANELVLLKSTLPNRAATIDQLADEGYLDRYFPKLQANLPALRLVDLRTSRELIANS